MTENVIALRPGPTTRRTVLDGLGTGNLLLFTGVRYVREGGPFAEPPARPRLKAVKAKKAVLPSAIDPTERLQA